MHQYSNLLYSNLRQTELINHAEHERLAQKVHKNQPHGRSARLKLKKAVGRNLMRLGGRLAFEPEWDEV